MAVKNGALSWNAKAALSFLGATFVVGLYDTALMGNVHPKSPQWFKDNQLFLYMWLTPVIMALIGVAIAYSVKGHRGGYLGLALAGLMVIIWQVEPLVTRWRYEGISHTGVCWVEAVLAVVVIRYALRAYREAAGAEDSSAPSRDHAGV